MTKDFSDHITAQYRKHWKLLGGTLNYRIETYSLAEKNDGRSDLKSINEHTWTLNYRNNRLF